MKSSRLRKIIWASREATFATPDTDYLAIGDHSAIQAPPIHAIIDADAASCRIAMENETVYDVLSKDLHVEPVLLYQSLTRHDSYLRLQIDLALLRAESGVLF